MAHPDNSVIDDGDFLTLKIIRNPFDTTDVISEEIQFQEGQNLAEYIGDLPERDAWVVGYNGLHAKPQLWNRVEPKRGDLITLTRVPEGGDGKNILRIVAIIAIAVFAAWAAPGIAGALGFVEGTAAFTAAVAGSAAAISVGGSLLVNALLPPVVPEFDKGNSVEESPSYGVDGPKNTSRLGLPVPVGYGTYRVAGNLSDVYTLNLYDTQYMFMRAVVNDGEIESLTDFEVNGQPLSNFKDVQTRTHLGTENQSANDWFNDAVRLVNRSVKLDTGWTTHTTDGPVDKIRLDVTAPRGLVTYDKKGKEQNVSVTVQAEYRAVGDTTWVPLTVRQMTSFSGASPDVTYIGATVAGNGTQVAGTTKRGFFASIAYRAVGDVAWQEIGQQFGEYNDVANPVYVPDGTEAEFVDPGFEVSFEKEVPAGQYEVQATGDGVISDFYGVPVTGSSSYTISGRSTKAIRRSLESPVLPRDQYEVRIRRTTADSNDTKTVDDVYLTDVGEIDLSKPTLKGTANYSVKIKITDQISSQPGITALGKLSKLQEYDRDGNPTVFQWSANPAWIVIDILTNQLRGRGMDLSRFDWESFVEWAEFCDSEGLEFNGVFDYQTNVWNATQNVLRAGHAQFVRLGTKWGVAIDRATNPTMVFNDTNMYRDTLKTDWVGLSDRANEILFSYADKDDGYKKKTIRLVDNDIATSGEATRTASYSQMGVTDVATASAEAEYQLRRNKLLKKSISFDAPIEAIGLVQGDVAAIHYQAGDFAGGVGGKLKAGASTTVLPLDRPVVLEAGETYNVLVYQDAVERYPVTIQSISGNNVYVTGLSGAVSDATRLIDGTVDVAIKGIYENGGNHLVRVDDASNLTLGSASLWDTNVIEERQISTGAGETESVTLTSPLSVAPAQYANFIIGKVASVKQLYRCIGISGNDLNRRSLAFIQYDENLYLPPGTPLPAPDIIGATVVKQVSDLSVVYNPYVTGDTSKVFLKASWNVTDALNYAGADLYLKVNGSSWERSKTVYDVSDVEFDADEGDSVEVKVVAFDKQGRRAVFDLAPKASINVTGKYRELDPPTNLAVSSETYDINGRLRLTWDAPVDESPTNYRVDVKEIDQTSYDAIILDPTLGEPQDGWTSGEISAWDSGFENAFTTSGLSNYVDNLKVGYYQFRVRAERGLSVSEWEVLTYAVAEPNFIGAITGLYLDGSTSGSPTTTESDTATVVVTVNPAAAPGPAAGTLTTGLTEAESLNITGDYQIQARTGASGGSVVGHSTDAPASGTIYGTFTGNAGIHTIDVMWVNENDGESTWQLLVNNVEVDSWVGTGGGSPGDYTINSTTGVELQPGDEIKIVGTAGTGERTRVDYFDITYTAALPAPTPPATGGTAVNDTLTTNQDTAGSVNVLANETAPNGTYAVVSFTQPANGTVVETSPGVLQYTPNAGYNGYDTFTYTVNWEVAGVPSGTEFTGNEPTFKWDDIFTSAVGEANEADIPFLLKHYEVNIIDPSDGVTILRTEYVTEPTYTYTYDKNVADSAGQAFNARREITISVQAIGRQNQQSTPATLTVSNPAPANVGTPVINGTTVTLPLPNDADFRGFRVWVKQFDTIDPATDEYFDIVQNEFRVNAPEGETRYAKFAPFDAFDRDVANLDVSASFAVIGEVFNATNLDYTSFASGVEPISIVDVLPDPTGYVGPQVVFLTTDLKLYRYTGSGWTTEVPAVDISGQLAAGQIGDGSIDAAAFASNITPVEIVASLPVSNNFVGRTVVLTTDGKLYRHDGTNWTATVPSADITGQLANTQIGDNAITTGKIAAGAVQAASIAAGAVQAGAIAADAVTATAIAADAVTADALAANSVTAAAIAADSINAGHIVAGAITTSELAANAVTADKIAANQINAGHINVVNLSAISADLGSVTAGSININGRFIVASNGTVTLSSASSGQRLVITNSLIRVYDASNTLRVRLGIW